MKTTKSEIIRKAAGLFVHNGYHGTSLNDISEAVGIKKAGLFFHFKNKEDLYKAVLDRYVNSIPPPKVIFAESKHYTLAKFIETFTEKKTYFLNSMKDVIEKEEINFSQAMTFLLECSRTDTSCQKAIVNFDKEMLDVWKVLVLKAQQTNEITDKYPAELIASTIYMAYKGHLMSKAFCTVEPDKSKELLERTYVLFKKDV